MARRACAKCGERLGEVKEAIELGAFLRGSKIDVVEVLTPPGSVRSGGLQFRAGVRGNPGPSKPEESSGCVRARPALDR